MSLEEILKLISEISDHGALGVVTTIIIFLGSVVVEKSKHIKLNPFTFVGKLLTDSFMTNVTESQNLMLEKLGDVDTKVSNLEHKVDDVKEENVELSKELRKARQDSIDRYEKSSEKYDELKESIKYEAKATKMEMYRLDFFDFVESLDHDVEHTKEHWNDVHDHTKEYVDFCEEHDKFINSRCEDAIQTINEKWEERPWKKD